MSNERSRRNTMRSTNSLHWLKRVWNGLKSISVLLLAVLFLTLLAFGLWWRAGIESPASQQELFLKLIAEYVTSPELLLGVGSFVIALIAFTVDQRLKRVQQNENREAQIKELEEIPVLQRMLKYIELEEKSERESWDKYLIYKLSSNNKHIPSEQEFLQVISDVMRQRGWNELADLEKLYNHFFGEQERNHKSSISALVKMIGKAGANNTQLLLIADLVKLWDDYDADVKDLLVLALNQFSGETDLPQLPEVELANQVFNTPNRRRLLRSEELHRIFPQLNTPLLYNYDASWLHLQGCRDKPRIIDWLEHHDLVSNPFGCDDFKNYPFYPEGCARPDQWETFLDPVSLFAHCPATENVGALAHLLRAECLPVWKDDGEKAQWERPIREIFPILVSLERISLELPLPALAYAAAKTWLDILPFSPGALLDLLSAEQDAVLELLSWSIGAKSTMLNLIQRSRFSENAASRLLERKIKDFTSHLSPEYLPRAYVLLSWLTVRPPGLTQTYMILVFNGSEKLVAPQLFEETSPLISTLLQNGIVTKAISSTPVPSSLATPEIKLSWSDEWLRHSLHGQFDAAMNPDERSMAKSIRFHELFGPGATEGETTDKLISASHHSLARMLMLGNRLLQTHCEEREAPEKYLSIEEGWTSQMTDYV